MKKLAMLLVVILSAAMVLTACGGSKTTDKGAGTSSSNTANEAPYTVKYAFIVTGVLADMQAVTDEINKITLKELNVKLETLPLSFSAYTQQTTLMISSGEKLDMMTGPGGGLVSYVAQGKLMALDSYLEKDGKEVLKALGNYLKAGVVNGKTYDH